LGGGRAVIRREAKFRRRKKPQLWHLSGGLGGGSGGSPFSRGGTLERPFQKEIKQRPKGGSLPPIVEFKKKKATL